tara:strand:- start:48 stop:1601 length:1554 start_codon:yes stop_codon:yes gene_type:complete
MFRDLKEYQEIAKIYAEKVSKPENLEERRGSSVQQLAQNRANAFKPATPPQKGAGGGVGNPTNTRGTGTGAVKFQKPTGAAQGRTKRPEIKKPLPSTAEIRAKNPKVVPGTRVNEIGAKGGGKPSSGDLSMFKDKKPAAATPTPTPTPQAKPKMGSQDSKFIKKDKGAGFVKRGTPGARRAENKEKAKLRAKEMFKQRQADKAAGKPQLSGKERAQAMAKARLAAKNKPTATATPEKPAAPQAQEKPAAPQAQQKAAATPSGDKLKAGSFGISQKGKEQAAKNKAEVANKKTSGSVKTVNVGGKDVDLSKVGPGMRQKLLQKNVGTNAAKEVQKVNPKPGQTVTTKQDPKTGSVSSKVTQGTGGGTAGATGSAGSLEANKKKAAKMKEMEAKRNAMEKEFEIPESNQFDAYDLVLEYLLSSEQVATIEEANYVMTEMDAETIQGIVEEQKKNLDELALGTAAGVAGAITLGAMGLNAIRKMNKNKQKMDKGEKFTPGSTMDNIQKKKDLYKQMGITK